MGKLIVTEFITLDGIIDDPGRKNGADSPAQDASPAS